jgi:hypothetical protein
VQHRGLRCKVQVQEKLAIWLAGSGIAASDQDPSVKWLAIAVGPAALSGIEGRLFASKLALTGNSLVRFGGALDPVLKLAAPLGQLFYYHVASTACVPVCEVCRESDFLACSKLVLCHLMIFRAYMYRDGRLSETALLAKCRVQRRLRRCLLPRTSSVSVTGIPDGAIASRAVASHVSLAKLALASLSSRNYLG